MIYATCPVCKRRLRVLDPDWHYQKHTLKGHSVLTIGHGLNAPEHLRGSVLAQIGANRAAYSLDHDGYVVVKEGRPGEATIFFQCPGAREEITDIAFPTGGR